MYAACSYIIYYTHPPPQVIIECLPYNYAIFVIKHPQNPTHTPLNNIIKIPTLTFEHYQIICGCR